MKKNKILLAITTLLTASTLFSCANPVDTFQDSEDTGDDIVVVDVDKETAQTVIDAINGLTDDSTEEEINAVIKMYEDLTTRQQSYVSNYYKLEEQIIKIEVLKLVEHITALINSINEDAPDATLVEEARAAYNKFLNYGERWADKLATSLVEKLLRCELKIIGQVANPLLTKALSFDTTTREGGTHFKLLTQRIDSFLNSFDESTRESLDLYDDYLEVKERVDQVYFIAANEYISTSHDLPSGKLYSTLKSYEDDDYGILHEEDLTNFSLTGSKNIQFGTKADFSNYKYIGAFISWPHSGNYVQFINNEKMVYASDATVANEFFYIEIPTSSLGDLTGGNHSHFGAHYTNRNICNIAGYKVTGIVGIGVDIFKAEAAVKNVEDLIKALDETNLVEEEVVAARNAYDALLTDYDASWQAKVDATLVEKLIRCENSLVVGQVQKFINEANSISLTTNQNKTRFTLLAEQIDAKYEQLTPEQKAIVTNYDTYVTLRNSISNKTGIIYGGPFSYYHEGKSGTMTQVSDYTYGRWNRYDISPSKGGSMQLFFGKTGLDISSHGKIGMFMQFSHKNTETVWLIITSGWQITEMISLQNCLIDASTNTYYVEIDLGKVTGPFAFDPYLQVYFSQKMSYFKTTSIAYID